MRFSSEANCTPHTEMREPPGRLRPGLRPRGRVPSVSRVAKQAMIGKVQRPNAAPDATAPSGAFRDLGRTSALADLGGPRCPPEADLAVRRFFGLEWSIPQFRGDA